MQAFSDDDKSKRGLDIIRLLGLKLKRNGRVNTQWGDKTPLGLYLTLDRIINNANYPVID